MGDHLIVAKDYKDIPQIISETILTIQGERNPSENATVYSSDTTDKKESVDIIL
jgi:hypothetical protein